MTPSSIRNERSLCVRIVSSAMMVGSLSLIPRMILPNLNYRPPTLDTNESVARFLTLHTEADFYLTLQTITP
jgi:hypothetical protein